MHIPEDEAERRRLNERGREILRRKNGAVRPHREDGYVNILNKYGTKQDNSEAYKFEREPVIPDMQLTGLYEGNGLFSKIIDTPAEEALKHGFDLNLKSDEVNAFVEDALDDLEWEEKAATAIKWARLYGGALIVMLIDDGRGLEEAVDWEHIRSIDELRVYERSIVQPDSSSLYQQDYGGKGVGNRVSKFGQPEYYYVSSIYGSFKVHESRCLVFRNGVLPEQTSNATYLFWGMPEYVRIRRALRETVTAHTDSVKLLERSVQAIYSMKGLASLLTTDDGENQVLKRLQLVDTSRGLLNSIAIDSEGENYDFKTFQFSGVKDVIDATCNMLSALTNIPQTILFGRSPAGMNATGDSDFESYYNFVEKIQRLMLKRNLRTLLDVVFRAGIASGDVAEEPDYKLEFKPLWSLSDTEQAAVDQTKAQTEQIKAQTAQLYVDMQAIDPSEVRSRLASDEEFDVEDIISDDDENDLLKSLLGTEPDAMSDVEAAQRNLEQAQAPGGKEQTVTSQNLYRAQNGLNTDGGPGSGNFGHEGRPGEIGGSAPGDNVSEQCGKMMSRLSEINDELRKCNDEMISKGITPDIMERMQSLVAESESVKAKLESADPSSRSNVSKRLCEEGHPTKQQIVDSLPKEWRESYDPDSEQSFGAAFSAKIGSWCGEGYKDLKDDRVLDEAIHKSSAKWNSGNLYRGLSIDESELSLLKPGGSIKMNGISSWSSDISPAMSFATTEQCPVLIVDKSSGQRNALPIAQMSHRSWEKEVMYAANQSFRINSVKTQNVDYGESESGVASDFSRKTTRKVTVIEVEADKNNSH